jgi:hypothetical protein
MRAENASASLRAVLITAFNSRSFPSSQPFQGLLQAQLQLCLGSDPVPQLAIDRLPKQLDDVTKQLVRLP